MRNLPIIFLFLFMILFSCGETENKNAEGHSVEATGEVNETEKAESTGTIVFFGTSLTAGMGLDPDDAYPAIIQRKLDSMDLQYKVINAGLSGETTASGKNRLDWVLNQEVDIFLLELGANDGLRGVPLEETRQNLRQIIRTVREKNPGVRIILAGMQLPPNLGTEYTTKFRNIFPELAESYDTELIPFLLEDVAGNPDLNQQDGIHPTAEGQEIMAENVWEVLRPVIRKSLNP